MRVTDTVGQAKKQGKESVTVVDSPPNTLVSYRCGALAVQTLDLLAAMCARWMLTYHELSIHQPLAVADPRSSRLANVGKPLGLENQTLHALKTRSVLVVTQHPPVDSLDVPLDVTVLC